MKNLTLMFALFCLSFTLSSQKVDLDKENYTYPYRRLPDFALDKSFKTYSVNVDKTMALEYYSGENVTNKINIEGLKKVNGNAHININIWLGDLIIESSKVESRVEIHKDKDGKETGRSYYYWVELVYSFEGNAIAKDFKGGTLKTYIPALRSDKLIYKSGEYGNSQDAANYFNNNSLEIKTSLIRQEIDKAMTGLNSTLNNNFGFLSMISYENLWTLGSKKHPEYMAFGEAINNALTTIATISKDTIPAGLMEKFAPSIAYFEGLLTKYTLAEDKDQMKLRYAAYYNMAYIYYSIEDFDKAIEMCNLLVQNDYDIKDGERLLKEINGVKANLQKHSMPSLHFYLDYENAMPPQ
jgi:hypothetical protein